MVKCTDTGHLGYMLIVRVRSLMLLKSVFEQELLLRCLEAKLPMLHLRVTQTQHIPLVQSHYR